MKRIGLKQEFHGEGDHCGDLLQEIGPGHDEVILDVVGGSLSFIVPDDVSDDKVFEDNLSDRYICCKLKLENGAEMSLWINAGAEGVDLRLMGSKAAERVPGQLRVRTLS